MIKNLLLVFVKHPQAGRVKTRLAAEVGDQVALQVYQKLLAITRKAAFGVSDVERRVYFEEPPAQDPLWDSPHFKGHIQEGADLGRRMQNAFQQGFDDGFQRIVIIGSDCPGMSSSLLSQAFRILSRKEAVVGPANDGGYYLLGLSRPLPPVFRHKHWSSETVLYHTLRDFQQNNMEYELLDERIDIDTLDDLQHAGPDWEALCHMPLS